MEFQRYPKRVQENPAAPKHPLDLEMFDPTLMERAIFDITEASDEWLDVQPTTSLSAFGEEVELSARQQAIDEWWEQEDRLEDEVVACYIRNWIDQLGGEHSFMDAYELAMDQLSAEGSTRDRNIVADFRLSRKITGRSHPLYWGCTAKTEEYITQQLTIGDLHFDVIDFGESVPLTEACRKMIVCPESGNKTMYDSALGCSRGME